MFSFFINYHLPFNNRVIGQLSKVPFMCHMYRSGDLHDIIVKLNSITYNVLPKTLIQDTREIGNINSIMTLAIANDKMNCDIIYSSFSLGNLRVGN